MEPGQALRSFVFVIPLDDCGTEVATRTSQIGSAENVMIVQLDPLVQVNMNSKPSLVSGLSISSIVQSNILTLRCLRCQILMQRKTKKQPGQPRPSTVSHRQLRVMFQEVWDSARRISCTWEDSYHKAIR